MIPNSISPHYISGRPPDGVQVSIPGLQSFLNISQHALDKSQTSHALPTLSLRSDIGTEYTQPAQLIQSNGLQMVLPFGHQFTSPLPVNISITQQNKLEEQKNEEKLRSKRLSNRKSARVSRARKKQLEEELTRTNEQMKLHAKILDLLPDPTMSVDKSGKILYVSTACTRQFKASTQELMGDCIYNWLAPESKDVISQHIGDLFSSNEVKNSAESDSVHQLWIRPQTISNVKMMNKDGSCTQCSLSSNLRCVADEKDQKKETPVEVILVFRPQSQNHRKSNNHHKQVKTPMKRKGHYTEQDMNEHNIKFETQHPVKLKQEGSPQEQKRCFRNSMESIAKNSEDVHSAVKSLFLLRNTYN